MCVNYKLCVKLHKGSFAFNMEKFPSLQNFYTHAVTDVTDNYQVCSSLFWSHVSRVTSLSECSQMVFFNNGSQLLSQSVSDKGTYRAVWGQLKNLWEGEEHQDKATPWQDEIQQACAHTLHIFARTHFIYLPRTHFIYLPQKKQCYGSKICN